MEKTIKRKFDETKVDETGANEIKFYPKKKRTIIEYEPICLEIKKGIILHRPRIVELYTSPNVCDYSRLDCFTQYVLYPKITADSRNFHFNNLKMTERQCYICRETIKNIHWFYLYQCQKCGDRSLEYRYKTRDLTGFNALVIGGRIKLGYQVVLKLLRAGCKVMITSRNVNSALEFYEQEPDYLEWKSRLIVFSKSFDLGQVRELIPSLIQEINETFGENQLNILIQNAAQTINFDDDNDIDTTNVFREQEILDIIKQRGRKLTYPPVEWRETFAERYGRKLDFRRSNTWGKNIFQTSDEEIISVVQNNIIGTVLIDKHIIPIMKKNPDTYVIHVHAKEGTFDTHKTTKHMHTNIAKAGLHMLTRCLAGDANKDEPRPEYPQIHGVNPGWFSIDEYPIRARLKSKIYNPPIDEIDAASRVVHPIFHALVSSHTTWTNYDQCEKY
ncbi:putative oxidoreductase [Cotonvirus japonicus]|uniref:Oxidoreductase n=1 Tax=Cotonvirus japonicus TaxID=2811091 RepID=A0ABM7NRP1_9VIRU|nr:putative oxidoreductase [Cotonvirus japonicus]BCS82821.1 putative oxidoreductase [Cotonvirus japonicus]